MIPTTEKFVAALTQKASQPLTFDKLVKLFRVTAAEREEFLAFLAERVNEGDVFEIRGGQYAHPSRVGLVVGTFFGHPEGFGFVSPQDKSGEDLKISAQQTKGAMHGDKVVARLEKRTKRPRGRITRILKRVNERLICKLAIRRKMVAAIPLDERQHYPIYVDRDDVMGAADGQLVQVELTDYPTMRSGPAGIVVSVLGYPGEPDTEANAIAMKHGVKVEFPEEVLETAAKVPAKVRKADLKGRRDLRELPLVTIDGERARDFDDAVYVEKTSGGKFRLVVAIADVSHYVKPLGLLDVEAYERGNSTYFPDRVFPMLPEALSNGICSLNPNVERLAMAADMIYSRGGRLEEFEFYPAVIKSHHRLTYTIVAKVLEDPDCDEADELGSTAADILRMGELARVIRARRTERGSIDFDLPQAEIVLDLLGKPEDIVKSPRNAAHLLIEEFMIAANEAVAERLSDLDMPCPYRVHDEPAPDTVGSFREFIHNFGYTLKGVQKLKPKDFQELAKLVEGKPEERLINHMMLRSMKKAVYSPVNIGHFGLASTHYAHFTSPIRRYPDLVLHRVLKELCKKKKLSKKWIETEAEFQEKACPHLSDKERASEAAEREAIAWKKCEFMADKIGSEHWGFITGIASFGIFVELETYFVEGLVHVSSLGDDFYHYSERTQSLIGERNRRKFTIGDRLRVVVEAVDVNRRRIDFKLVK